MFIKHFSLIRDITVSYAVLTSKALLTSQHTEIISRCLKLTDRRARVSYTTHRGLHGNPVGKVCLSDGRQQLLGWLGSGEGLLLNAFPQIRAPSLQAGGCTAEGSRRLLRVAAHTESENLQMGAAPPIFYLSTANYN